MTGYNTEELELASDFQPFEGEANFGPPLTREVVGGAHIAPHAITLERAEFVMADWSEGLPRHGKPGKRSIRFPHGLMQFGETFDASARRLVANQLGLDVSRTQVVHVYSYVDDMRHWHMEPIIVTWVTGNPSPPQGATVARWPIGPTLPELAGWAGKPPFAEAFDQFIAKVL